MITLHHSTLMKIIGFSFFLGAMISALVTDPPTLGMMIGFVLIIIGVMCEPPRRAHD